LLVVSFLFLVFPAPPLELLFFPKIFSSHRPFISPAAFSTLSFLIGFAGIRFLVIFPCPNITLFFISEPFVGCSSLAVIWQQHHQIIFWQVQV
jgi:hypothetical protein